MPDSVDGLGADAAASIDQTGTSGGANPPESTDNSGGGLNPAWSPMLDKIPAGLHPMVTPHLQEWDKNFQTELQKVQSQYEPFKPFLEKGPETLQAATALYEMANNDPRALYQQLGDYFGFNAGGQGQEVDAGNGTGDEETFDISSGIESDPKFIEMQQNLQNMAALMVQQHEQEQQQQLQAQLEQEESTLREANPDLTDDDLVVIYQLAAGSGATLTEAANAYSTSVQNAMQRRSAPRAPSVMSANGQVPAESTIDPTKLDSKGTRNLVMQILQAQQGQG